MKTILTIQSQVAGAAVGNSVAAFAIERLGVRAIALPTTLLGIRPDRGDPGGGPIANDTLIGMVNALEASGVLKTVDAVLSGYIAQPEQALFVRNVVIRVKHARRDAVYLCDPVMGDGALYVKPEIADAIGQHLLPMADIVAPNLWELGKLTGRTLETLDDARAAAKTLGRTALVSSIPTQAGLGVLYAAETGDWLAETPRLPGAPRGGTGDLLTALFLTRRVKGEGVAFALEGALGATHDAIVRAIAAGSDDLLPAESGDVLTEPMTWPRAKKLS